jgi:tripartite-type tricarboxylate transporter receptor subunit TctC
LPTIAESGIPGFDVTQWYGMFLPARTSRAIADKMGAEVARAAQSADVMKRLAADGTETVGSKPEAFTALLKAETARWARVVKETGIKGN